MSRRSTLQRIVLEHLETYLAEAEGADPMGDGVPAQVEFLDRLAAIFPRSRIHRHRYHGVFAPNAPLGPLVTARAHQDNTAAAVQESVGDLPLPAALPPTSSPPKSEPPPPQPPDTAPAQPSRWAALLARRAPRKARSEVFPLICPPCGTALTFISCLTDSEPITRILSPIGEPTSPPLVHPARGPRRPPQAEFDMGLGGGEAKEPAQACFPDDLDQTPEFDPAEPEPAPADDFDQIRSR